MKMIKSATYNDRAKELGYWLIYAVYWLITLPIILTNQMHFTASYLMEGIMWHIIIWILIAWIGLTVVLPAILLPFVKQLREKVSENYDSKLYPVTGKQQFMFIFVAITVGICEEIIFRGFLQHYAVELGLSELWSFVIISVIFGAGHFLQGLSGVISSTIFGLIMGYLYFVTGSLFVPIIVHIVYDAKVIYMTRFIQKKPEDEKWYV
ncbi:CPBP family intramembrane metalloprotease [Paenibacillus sp. WST5]|uniref:CPBP family intramembrane metalloprotease n=1 Tax=Paenibacillus sedimenti TaxID=2770274 RepID=A0A926KNS7_9BACL|nr:CPBP family intramembrane metalloprotease [Paenibacillus sedimenti]